MEVLQHLHGAYSVSVDGEQGTVKISGQVNPSLVLRVLERDGRHAEILFIRFNGEVEENNRYYNVPENGYNNPHRITYPYPASIGPQYPCYERAPPPRFIQPPPLPLSPTVSDFQVPPPPPEVALNEIENPPEYCTLM